MVFGTTAGRRRPLLSRKSWREDSWVVGIATGRCHGSHSQTRTARRSHLNRLRLLPKKVLPILITIGEGVGFDGSALAYASRLVAKVDSAAVRLRP